MQFWLGRSLFFKLLKRLTAVKFPNVQWITTKELAQWLQDSVKPQPIILDARSQVEYAVSHLQQAQHIDPIAPDLTQFREISLDTPIVVYCSVGYRSAGVAQQLTQAGFSHVYNLEGSLFQWANEGRPIFKEDCPTQFVHPYNAIWGKLLKSRYRDRAFLDQKSLSIP
jgi:rhodanese-related sulfurtransferase